MPVDICLVLRELLARKDLNGVRDDYSWLDRRHRLMAERWQPPGPGEVSGSDYQSQELTFTDDFLERVLPEAGERALKRMPRRLLTKEERAKDAG